MPAKLTKEIVNERVADKGIVLVGEYVDTQTKSLFQCSKDHEWLTRPNDVMRGGGCPYCAGNLPLSKEIVNERIAHRGIVMIGEYTQANAKALFQCSKGHKWLARPNHVMRGIGCPSCAKYGFDQGKSAILYYIRFETDYGPLWKIGITNLDVPTRFTSEPTPYTIIRQWQYDDGSEALSAENKILRRFRYHRYSGPPPLRDGNSELFISDILCLDTPTTASIGSLPQFTPNTQIQMQFMF